jgi:pimeloyl-ACP methyl ester carboxylesterase
MRYFASLYPSARPDDFPAYLQRLRANLRAPGRFSALRQMLFASKAASAARLPKVTAPALILMGTRDRDFKDPAAEGQRVAQELSGTTAAMRMIEGAGHYPHAELPRLTAPVIIDFLTSIREVVAHGA